MKEKNRKIRKTILKNYAKKVVCINEDKNLFLELSSMYLASYFTKTNIRIVSEIMKGSRTSKTINGWFFYSDIESYINPKPIKVWDCNIHEVDLMKGSDCPLCDHDQKMLAYKDLFKEK